MNIIIKDGERRIVEQEERIERLRRDGHSTETAEDFLRMMLEMRKLQFKMREDLERLLKDQNSSN